MNLQCDVSAHFTAAMCCYATILQQGYPLIKQALACQCARCFTSTTIHDDGDRPIQQTLRWFFSHSVVPPDPP